MFGFHERDTCSLLPFPYQGHSQPSYSNQGQLTGRVSIELIDLVNPLGFME